MPLRSLIWVVASADELRNPLSRWHMGHISYGLHAANDRKWQRNEVSLLLQSLEILLCWRALHQPCQTLEVHCRKKKKKVHYSPHLLHQTSCLLLSFRGDFPRPLQHLPHLPYRVFPYKCLAGLIHFSVWFL